MPKLSVAETAERFGVSRQRVLAWIHDFRLATTWENGAPGPQRGRYMISERAPRPKPIRPARRNKQ